MFLNRTRTVIYLLIATSIAAPMHALTEPRDITIPMIKDAAVHVGADFKKATRIRWATIIGVPLAVAGSGYFLFNAGAALGNGQAQASSQPVVLVPSTQEGIAKGIQDVKFDLKALLERSTTEGFGSQLKSFLRTILFIGAFGVVGNALKNWFFGPEQLFGSMDAFKYEKTEFNQNKLIIEEKLQVQADDAVGNVTSDKLDYWSQFYARINRDVLKLCGYMEFRVEQYRAARVAEADIEQFITILKNIITITQNTNQQLRTLFSNAQGMDKIVETISRYATQIDIECGAFGVFEGSFRKGR